MLPSVNIGLMYCQNCTAGGRAQWVLDESLRRIESLLDLPRPSDFFAPMVASGHLHATPDMRSLVGAKRMLLDQAHIDDALETSVWRLHSRRRTIAAWLPHRDGRSLMTFHGWNATKYADAAPGPAWTHQKGGLVWEELSYPKEAAKETVHAPPVDDAVCNASLVASRLLHGGAGC
jgi:hypothetical protein